jgi:hypothetical protein
MREECHERSSLKASRDRAGSSPAIDSLSGQQRLKRVSRQAMQLIAVKDVV